MNYITVFSQNSAFVPLNNSVLMGLAAIVAGILISLFVVTLVHRARSAAANALDLTFMIPWILPAPFVAIRLILSFDDPNPLVFGQTLLGSFWIFPIG